MNNKRYNLIMHSDPEFWSNSNQCVDFPKDRFLEYTSDDLIGEFQSLDQNAIKKLKKLPTLFAIEHENASTRIGKITDIEVRPDVLRIKYQFDQDYYPIASGALKRDHHELNIEEAAYEFYRTHWALKEGDIPYFYQKYLKTLAGVAYQLKGNTQKVQLIYAFNGTGKTRLSREFKELLMADNDTGDSSDAEISELSSKNILYYSAFTEDLFYWDNDLNGDEDRKLKIQPNAFTKWILEDQGQGPTIIDHFQRLTNSNIEPTFSADFSEISFAIRGDGQGSSIKISKGEESNLIWSIFYSLLELIIEELSSSEDDRGTDDFNRLKYVFIDDPVSSLDDNHLIELAVDLAKLVKSSSADLKFIITTHNPLFYNVLSNEFNNKLAKDPSAGTIEWLYKPSESVKFRLDKNVDGTFAITKLDRKTPFSYHLLLLSEIRDAIQSNQIKKYHFNFLRNILEKTTTFLGHDKWENLLPKAADGNPDPFANRILNLSSHSAHAGEETGELEANDKEKLEKLVNFLSTEYGFWKQEEQND